MTIPLEDQHPLQARATLTGMRAVIEREDAPSEIVTASDGQDLRAAVVEHVTRIAFAAGPIELRTVGDRGDHRLLLSPNGEITRLDPPVAVAEKPAPALTAPPLPEGFD
ncbi:hypothetical protein ABY45_01330, partial [Microbacterium maritypicum]